MLVSILGAVDRGYEASVRRWRQEREAELKSDQGWLTVTGLFWLKEGINTPVKEPHVGTFEFHDGKTTFHADPALSETMNGNRITTAVLRPDTEPGGPDRVDVANLTMFVIHRGARYAIRVKDKNSQYRRAFSGLHWYPVREDYRIVARFVAYQAPHPINIPNILGETEQEPSPGYAAFTLQGHEYRLDPVIEDGELFFVFRDQTSGRETYGSGRFLHAAMPKDGKVILDFNKAYNPPCAFTPYATCPLPPRQNRLPVRIEAGELTYGHH